MNDVTLNPVQKLAETIRQIPGHSSMEEYTYHHFCRGLYARELFIPAGTTAVGKIHAQQNFFLLVKGELEMATAEGPVRLQAPYMVVTEPGTQRAVYAHEDCICLTFHPNPDDERDLDQLEARYITPEALPAPDTQEKLT